jgi:hypothetical protein
LKVSVRLTRAPATGKAVTDKAMDRSVAF